MTTPEKPRMWKVLGASGEAVHGGSGTWLLPRGDEPAGWMPTIKGRLKACELGYHLTPKPIYFYIPGSRVFEAEWQGDVDDTQAEIPNSPKIAVRECRLLREVKWAEFCVWFEGEHTIEAGCALAYDSASVRAYDSASVTAYGSASVTAYGSASVTAYDSASVTAYDSASVTAADSASVTAYDSASVTAYGSASVRAYGSASVRAYDSASVRAYDSASVTSTVYHSASAVVALEGMAVHIDRRNGRLVLRGARGGELAVPQS